MDRLTKLVERLENIADRLETDSVRQKSCISTMPKSHSVGLFSSFDEIISGPLQSYVAASKDVCDDVFKHAEILQHSFDEVKRVITQGAMNASEPVKASCISAINAVTTYKDDKRKSVYFNHFSATAEFVAALMWFSCPDKPDKYIKEMIEAGKFYTNRVLKEFKEKPNADIHVKWVNSLLGLWTAFLQYVQRNPTGEKLPDGVPPPPAPPPAYVPSADTSKGDQANIAALFADINKGTEVTSGLRKITDDMKTHKNPTLRVTSQVKASPDKAPTVPIRPDQRASQKQPAVCELRNNKWVVENHVGNKNLKIEVKSIKESIYIYKCVDSCIQVKSKANSIALDNCKKTSLLFEDVISSVDIVNSQNIQIQVTGLLPNVNIDKTDGCQVYLSALSKDIKIITAKSSEMNVLIPGDDGEFVEYPIPEQFVTTFDGSSLKTKQADC